MNQVTTSVEYINPLNHPICLAQPYRLDNISTWVEHIPFGMFIVDILCPKILVELGTDTGISYNTFCQAVKELGLDTRCYSVDTWEGDAHASLYGTDVLASLRAHHDPLYGDFSRIIQSTFDEAVKYFSNGSIDLLHINGLDTYEAVKHNFETWLPKLSPRAVVLFHDINIREKGFGVWKFWAELRQKYPHFEFFHGHGLGVLHVGVESTPILDSLFSMSDEQSKQIREFFVTIGSRYSIQVSNQDQIQLLIAQVAEKDAILSKTQAQIVEKEESVRALTEQLVDKDAVLLQTQTRITKKEEIIQILIAQLADKDAILLQTQAQIADKEQALKVLRSQVAKHKRDLVEIRNSKAWRIALLVRRINTVLMPPNSMRARMPRALISIIYALFKKTRRNQEINEDIALIQSSDLFNERWYLANNPHIAQIKINPVRHYLLFGGFEGLDPGPNFSSNWYLNTYQDIKKAGDNPLVHYLKYGKSEGRHPNLESSDLALIMSCDLFDKTWYLANNPDIAQAKIDPLHHYLHYGGFEGRDPGPNFSSNWYLITYQDVKKAGVNPLVHYLKYGKSEGNHPNLESNDLALIISSDLFDKTWYLANNPDIAQAKIDPLHHYLHYGGFKGRDPGPNFSSQWYLDTYEDIKKTGENPLVHFLKYGKSEGHHPNLESNDLALIMSCGLFDETWYLTNYHDVKEAAVDPLRHYLYYGGFGGRDPGPNFNSNWYLHTYQDVKKTGVNPLVHYLKYGLKESRKTKPDPILVYTMGKVGSTTVMQSLINAYNTINIKVPFHHAHLLNELDAVAQAVQELPNPVESLQELIRNKKVRDEIDQNLELYWNIVSLVRDPVARNVATLFNNLSGFIPDWDQRYANGTLNVRELHKWLINSRIINSSPNHWFDRQIKQIPAFDIDVYAEPFPKEIGYKIYCGPSRARLLLIRMENLNECAEHTMHEFLSLENFTIENANIGEEKDYADLYRIFKSHPLPLEYVQKTYNTQVARHFYTDEELHAFAKRWTGMDELQLDRLDKNP